MYIFTAIAYCLLPIALWPTRVTFAIVDVSTLHIVRRCAEVARGQAFDFKLLWSIPLHLLSNRQ